MQADETQRSRVRNADSRAADKKYPAVHAGRGAAIVIGTGSSIPDGKLFHPSSASGSTVVDGK